jgi:hypothetical protein
MNILFHTIADCWNENPAEFNKALKECFVDAANSIPQDILIKALCDDCFSLKSDYKKAA